MNSPRDISSVEHIRKNASSFKTPKTHKKLNGWQWHKKGERLVTGNICQILTLVIASLMREEDSKQDILF